MCPNTCDSYNCDSCIPAVDVGNCESIDYGKTIVKIFLQKSTGAGFDDLADLALEATWTTKLAIPPYGSCTERIVAIGNLHEGLVLTTEDETEMAPYGGDELVTRKHSATFKIKYYNANLFDDINALRCFSNYRFWYLTEKGYLFGGIAGIVNASFLWGKLEFAGIGNGSSKSSHIVSWFSHDDETPISAAFLAPIDFTNPE